MLCQQGIQCEERLGRRGDVEDGVGIDGGLRRDIGKAEVTLVSDLAVLHHDHRGAGRVAGVALECFDGLREWVEGIGVRGRGLRLRQQQGQRQRQPVGEPERATGFAGNGRGMHRGGLLEGCGRDTRTVRGVAVDGAWHGTIGAWIRTPM